MSESRIRVLLAKPGLDGHDRGVKVIARALRDAGMEVIYTGLRQTPIFPRIRNLMQERGMGDVLLFGGGIIPEEDIPKLKEAGVSEIFLPGTSTEDIIRFIRDNVTPRE
jgi:methylmalonyl-CoA mutase C-terminal domain/subunit